MSDYTDHCAIEPFSERIDGHLVWRWRLMEPLKWDVGYKDSGLTVTVPSGFVTDLASIPRWAHWIFNPNRPETAKAACIHDWMLPSPADRTADPTRILWDNRTAAGEFYACLRADELPRFERKIYFVAVLFGISKEDW